MGDVTVRAAVFDIGGVLERVDDDSWPAAWMRRWERRAQVPDGHTASALSRHDPTGGVVIGEVSETQLREIYAAALGLDDADAHQMMTEMWDAYCGELDVALRDYVVGLRPRLKTAILTNSADGARREEQRRYDFEHLLDILVYSHEVGLAKPDPAIFALAEELLGAAPHEIVFLDDNETHVQAARARGWHAVLHRDTQTSIRDLRALGA